MTLYNYFGKINLIGGRVKQRRRELGMSQGDLAAKLQIEGVDVVQKSVSRIETGNRIVTDYEVLSLAKVLKVDVMWLLTGENPTR